MKKTKKAIQYWVKPRQAQIFIYNLLVMFFVVMHSLGYFHPYFEITANVVIVFSILLAVVLLGIGSRGVFSLAFFFWVVSAFFRTTSIDVWAERVAMYSFESLFIGLLVLVYEQCFWIIKPYLKLIKTHV